VVLAPFQKLVTKTSVCLSLAFLLMHVQNHPSDQISPRQYFVVVPKFTLQQFSKSNAADFHSLLLKNAL